ncbi:interleukin-7 receptor subunit alpha isoform X2 [Coregonus clupeaformis]|uniref:interleukin-7 receptor subunit alpha isoform X2 n=1 Tax=Coregonus clupeaformis TaxID=59861 RepID=UPI001BE04153|nr:interleukin-7 receptor subunit alpha isoform X2 [Coregonus clupeaformis]
MAYSLWIALVLLPVLVHSQSGREWADNEPRILCTSHLSLLSPNTLTCHLDDDNEDDEIEDVKAMTLCYSESSDEQRCLTENGNNVTFTDLATLPLYNLTIQLNRGSTFWKTIILAKIIKPMSPWVVNVTFLWSSNQAFIYIGNPYLNDYLKPNNQLFQFRIWSVKNTLVQNITYQPLIIEGDEYLHKNTEYHVKVRAKPNGKYFDGSWSEWSASLSFRTDAETNVQMLTYSLIVAIFDLLLVTLAVSIFWRKQIHSFIWPSIPHPKHTLLQIVQTYEPMKGQPLSFNPEVFSDLNIQPVELAGEQHVTAQPTDSDAQYLTEVKDQCLIQECDGDTKSCHSTSTGGSEAILLRCESPGEHLNFGAGSTDSNMCILDLKSDTESVETDDSDGNVGSEGLGATQQDEVYVTMSSFYQIQ